jgi:galactokinase
MATLANFADTADFYGPLHRAGLSEAAANRHGPIFERLAHALMAGGLSASSKVRAYFVPGRIEMLGKHTDYAGGDSLVCAVERGFCILASRTDESGFTLTDAGRGEVATIDEAVETRRPRFDWTRYPAAVYRRAAANFGPLVGGLRIAFASTLPPDAGLSSSSAFMVGCFMALSDAHDLPDDSRYRGAITSRIDLADYLGHIENGQTYKSLAGEAGVGTFGGSQDHAAILCSEPGAIVRFQYAPTRQRGAVILPPNLLFVVATSGVPARKTGGVMADYNRASLLAGRVAERWCARYPESGSCLRDIIESPGFAPALMETLQETDPELLRRYRHFYTEHSQLVPAAFQIMEGGDWEALGHLVDRSQALAEAWLGNQVPETIALARLARSHGAIAASAFGAGFGGAVWALSTVDRAEAFASRWICAYRTAFPDHTGANVFITRPGAPAIRLLTKT